MLTRFESAQFWLDQGVHLVPIKTGSKHLVAGFGPYRDHVTTLAAARHWFVDRSCNLGVICGTGNEEKLIVGDFDSMQSYEAWRARIGPAANTFAEETARGVHVFYFSSDAPSGTAQGIEVKGRGSVVMVTPSIHPSGVVYRRINDLLIARVGNVAPIFSLLSEIPEVRPSREDRENVGQEARVALGADVIARIKSRVEVAALASKLTTLRSSDGGQGRWFVGRCPFHDDQHPSFWLDAKRGLWGCQAASCPINVGGRRAHDVINLYARSQDIDDREAIQRMAREYLPLRVKGFVEF